MHIEEIRLSGVLVVRAGADRIDLLNADAFKDALATSLTAPESLIVLDLSSVDYISSAGLRCLTIANRTAKAAGSILAVAALRPLVLEVFQISRFDRLFPVFDTVSSAVTELAPDAIREWNAR